MASDYQGETIQVFVFLRGKFLGYQCFGQDRLTIGGAPGMDLPLPDCPEEEGYWDIYVSRGALYAWFRGPATDGGKEEGRGDPRKVQPLDSFSLGEYRLQAKLLQGEGFAQDSDRREEGVAGQEIAPLPGDAGDEDEPPADGEEGGREDEEVRAGGEPDEQGEIDREPDPEPTEEVEGISLDYARSIWKGEGDLSRDESDAGAGPVVQTAELDEDRGFWSLSEEVVPALDEPDAFEDEAAATEEGTPWIGFGLEEDGEGPVIADREEGLSVDPAEEGPDGREAAPLDAEVPVSDAVHGPEALEEEGAPPEMHADEQAPSPSSPESESAGVAERMNREERIRFWDEMAREAVMDRQEDEQEDEPWEIHAAESPVREASPAASEDPPAAADDMGVSESEEALPPGEPAAAGECMEGANTAVAIDEEETGEEDEDWEDEDEEESEQNITYFSLVKEVFPDRTKPAEALRGDDRAVEVVRFRGGDVQDVGYLESGDAYTIRRGWSRSLWKRRGGVPPDFKLLRLKNGGLAELHIRDSVEGRLYSDTGSQDIRALRGDSRRRFGRKEKASWLPMPADTWAVLRVNSGRYLVRYVPRRPKPKAQPLRPNIGAGQFKLVSISMLSHLLLILVIGLAVPDKTLEGYSRVDQFARIDPNALSALKPPPPKKLEKPKPMVKKKARKPKPKRKPKATVASKHRIPKSARRSPVPTQGKASGGGGGKKKVDVAQTGLLAALGSPDAGVLNAKGNSEVLLAAVTNLDAVAVPSDTTTFNLAGVAGKLATSEIQVPTSEEIETVGAAQLIKNGDGTLGVMASKGSGEVRAVVHEPPKAKISIRGGMSRAAVLKVVNSHLDEIQDCYERELLHNPGISGKILMEWLIQLDGTVRYAKVKFTNIGRSSDLHTCLQAQVVTWNFPRPKGGQEVLVTFPFLFENMGF